MFFFTIKLKLCLFWFLPIFTLFVLTFKGFGQKSTCYPYPLTLKSFPASVRNSPNVVKAVETANSQPWFKKTIVLDFSKRVGWQYFNTYMVVCPGEHIQIKATGEAWPVRNPDYPPLTYKDIITPVGNPNISCYESMFSQKGYLCGELMADFEERDGVFDKNRLIQVGNEYNGVIKERGSLILCCDKFPNSAGLYTGKWTIDIQLTYADSCGFPDGSEGPDFGDVVMYWFGSHVIHSGIVTAVDNECRVKKINCWSVPLQKQIEIDPDDLVENYGNWIVYHRDLPSNTNLKSKNNIKIVDIPVGNLWTWTDLPSFHINKDQMGETDNRKTNIFFAIGNGQSLYNCHGFTFGTNNQYGGIVGYRNVLDGTLHYDQSKYDQETAAEFILRDNGYRQVHAKGTNTDDHFKTIYGINNFTYQ